jgi:hypothetical protein
MALMDLYDNTGFKFKDSTVGDIIGGKNGTIGLLSYIYVAAGLILLVMLIAGGLTLMTAIGNPDKIKAGQGRITSALIGFLIIFISYFIVQLIQVIFGVSIL